MEPRIFKFGTPYEEMFKSMSATPEDQAFFIRNGVLHLCRRGAAVKRAPQRWQDMPSDFLSTHDVVIAFEERIFDAVIEDLQVAELVNFFRADCVVTNPTEIDQIDASAAVIYPIILENSLEIIVRFPGQPSESSLKHYSIDVEKDTVEQQLDRLQQIISNYPSNTALENLDQLRARSTPNDRAGIVPRRRGETLESVDFITPAEQVY